MTRQTVPITLFRDDEDGGIEETINVPFHFEICQGCNGHGTDRGNSVECDGGGFTSSEWAEQDDDFKRNYLAGAYDQPCQACREHPGRIKVPDLDVLSADDRALYLQQERDDADERSLRAAERRMAA